MSKNTRYLKEGDLRVFQLTSLIGFTWSLIFQYLIVKSYLTGSEFIIILDFNASGEGLIEMLLLFPICIVITGFGLLLSYWLE